MQIARLKPFLFHRLARDGVTRWRHYMRVSVYPGGHSYNIIIMRKPTIGHRPNNLRVCLW